MGCLNCSKCSDLFPTETSHVHLKPCNHHVCFGCMIKSCLYSDKSSGLCCLNGNCNETVVGFDVLQSLPSSKDQEPRVTRFRENKRQKTEWPASNTAFKCESCETSYDSCKIMLDSCNHEVCVACVLYHTWDRDNRGDGLLCCVAGCNIRAREFNLEVSGREALATCRYLKRVSIPVGKMKMQNSEQNEVWVNTNLLALYPTCRSISKIKKLREFPDNASRSEYIKSEVTGSPEYAKAVYGNSCVPFLLQEEIRRDFYDECDPDPDVVKLLARLHPEGLLESNVAAPNFFFDVMERCPSVLLDIPQTCRKALCMKRNSLKKTPLLWYLQKGEYNRLPFSEEIVAAILDAHPDALLESIQSYDGVSRIYPLAYACSRLDISADGDHTSTELILRFIDGSPGEAFVSNYYGTPLLRLCERAHKNGGFNANTVRVIRYLANKAPQAIGIHYENNNGPLPIHYVAMGRGSPEHRLSLVQTFYRLDPETLNAGPARLGYRYPRPRSDLLIDAAIPLLAHAEALRKTQVLLRGNVAIGNYLTRQLDEFTEWELDEFTVKWASAFRDNSQNGLIVTTEAMAETEARLRELCNLYGGNGDAFHMM